MKEYLSSFLSVPLEKIATSMTVNTISPLIWKSHVSLHHFRALHAVGVIHLLWVLLIVARQQSFSMVEDGFVTAVVWLQRALLANQLSAFAHSITVKTNYGFPFTLSCVLTQLSTLLFFCWVLFINSIVFDWKSSNLDKCWCKGLCFTYME